MSLIPPIGTSGLFQLASPFNNKLQTNMAYRCDAVRRISDLIELGIEPFEEYYQPNGISKTAYDNDLINRVSIVSLVSDAGHWVYVPSTYILAYPDLNGVPYHVMLLGLEIGAIPRYRDLTGVKVAIANLVRDTLGITPTVRESVISAEQMVSQQDHEVLESARGNLITNSQTDRAKLLAAQTELTALRGQLTQLENYIKTLVS